MNKTNSGKTVEKTEGNQISKLRCNMLADSSKCNEVK